MPYFSSFCFSEKGDPLAVGEIPNMRKANVKMGAIEELIQAVGCSLQQTLSRQLGITTKCRHKIYVAYISRD